MRLSVRTLLIPVFLAFVTAAIYLPDLQGSPPFLSNDEACIALNARAIAATGHDVDGRFMPSLFYSPASFAPNGVRIWFLPILVYSTALVLKILPFTETAVRLPLVVAAIADVLLVYLIALRIFRRRPVAVAAAILLALTPAHFFHARLALPAQISGPFVLGWLLCVLVYLDRRQARWLFASGVLLGVAAVGYIGPLVIGYGLLTWAVLYQRRDRWPPYAAIVAGGILPCLYFLWLARDPAIVHEILGHYQQPAAGGGIVGRVAGILALYWNFWSPDFLFVEGAVRNARASGVIGVFLLPLAGLVAIGVFRALLRRDAISTLLLGGFLIAPVTASFAGENQAIWRALEVAPFGVLLAALGLEPLLSEDRAAPAPWAAYVAAFGLSLAVASRYRDHLQHAQPMIRALVVPLAVALVALLLRKLRDAPLSTRSLLPAAVAIAATQAAYVTPLADLVNVVIPVLAIVALLFVTDAAPIAALVGLLAGEFLYLHIDYAPVSRVGAIPASAVLMAMRLATLGGVLAISSGIAVIVRRRTPPPAHAGRSLAAAIAAVVALQAAYFHVGAVTGHASRLLFVSAILVCAIGAAAALAGVAGDRRTFARLGAAALLTAAFVQFGYFYADYLTGYPQRNMVTAAGNVRVAWERVIDEAAQRDIPAVFVGPIGAYGDAGLYWRFYVAKHHREDLLTRTIENEPFERARIRRLPHGSIVVVSPSADVDRLVRQMEAAGELTRDGSDGLISAPDGTPLFWMLERL
jgi:4-amino-4-deoxy-L-arabinose transferase-like glycosyltransferase